MIFLEQSHRFRDDFKRMGLDEGDFPNVTLTFKTRRSLYAAIAKTKQEFEPICQFFGTEELPKSDDYSFKMAGITYVFKELESPTQ